MAFHITREVVEKAVEMLETCGDTEGVVVQNNITMVKNDRS